MESAEPVRQDATEGGPPALPPPLRGPIAVVAILAALVLTAVGAQYAGEAAPGRLDTWTQSAVAQWWPEPGGGALVIDFVGEPLGVILLVVLLMAVSLALGRRRLAVVVVAGLGVTGVVTTGLKPVVDRTIHGEFLSYPSGHTATATVFALIVMLLLVDLLNVRRLPAVLLILAGAGVAGAGMALSQIALGAHYPTDTLGGFCTAMVVVPATAYLVDRLPEPRVWLERASTDKDLHPMGKHDQDNVKDGQWSKPVPQDDVRDTRKDDGKHSGGGAEQDSGHDSDQDEK